MRKKRVCQWIALTLTMTMTADVIPAFAFPVEVVSNEATEELLWPEGDDTRGYRFRNTCGGDQR